ncbi:uncharacterized protein EKO05_0005340 [Ascochyta rabiei]|uniref:Uncharacterized protein n=1 Tax=Didymella rabiei TaxID=5454 RepID=A0A163JMX5_DIDRA|nr:uncharacterized protein EKO05_0005340 [Ascochyta rabiei]KZM26461.1 hypothetical protein ST47_g2204 [Ascochyta rabiei]UPX14869.1 hypothetical protein EKO05_0005340 [Ascochyta rabiei]
MSQAAGPEMTFASGRYSKRKRTQVNYRMEELDVDETDIESKDDVVQPKKQRKTAASRPLPKHKIFPFLELPAEIRNMIYTYALTDSSGINFVAVQRNKRRCVERVSRKVFDSVSRFRSPYQPSRTNNSPDDTNDLPAPLMPSLLAVNKQINQEGSDILYSNELVFADPVALYSFMINLGPGSASHLRIIRLNGWDRGRTSKAYNNACFAVLISATNLEKLHIDTSMGWFRHSKGAAQLFYRNAFPWLEAVGTTKGKYDAALDILDVTEEALGRNYYSSSQGQPGGDRRKMFNAELSRSLGLQWNRIMGKSVKKGKTSKVSNKSRKTDSSN